MVARSLSALFVAAVLVVPAAAQDVKLPDTPQGKIVAGYIKAFNSGDEKTFLTFHTEHMAEDTLKRRTEADRKDLFKRMKDDFGQLKPARIIEAKADAISLAVPTLGGDEATMVFTFETAAPYKINGISVQVGG